MKLTELVQLQKESRTLMNICNIKNTLKRNIALPSQKLLHSEAQQQYETKLTGHNFSPKDMQLLFQHLYSKESMTSSDRNLLRRLLLSYFPEKLIACAGKSIISHSKLEKFDCEETKEGEKKFYLVLSGSVRVQSPYYHKDIRFGMYTGHLENLCNASGKSYELTFSSHTMALSFCDQSFKQLFSAYFESIYKPKKSLIPTWVGKNISPQETYLLCDEMSEQFIAGPSIFKKKGESIENIYFFQKQAIKQTTDFISLFKIKMNCQKTLGLAEYFLKKKRYQENIFIKEPLLCYSISTAKFLQHIPRKTFQEVRDTSKMGIMISRGNTRTDTPSLSSNVEILQKFMKVKKVRLPYSKTVRTLGAQNVSQISSEKRQRVVCGDEQMSTMNPQKYEANFIFFKYPRDLSLRRQKVTCRELSNKSEIMGQSVRKNQKIGPKMKRNRMLFKKRIDTSLV